MMRSQQKHQTTAGAEPSVALSRPEWLPFLDEHEWLAFQEIVGAAAEAGIDILIGGALALAAYMPLRRQTKDVDFYVLPEDRQRMISLLNKAGFEDLFDRLPYDRGWIYRGVRDDVIADVIWRFANRRADVDADWFRFSHEAKYDQGVLRIVPPEEIVWAKLFVMQRERCDWPDLLNLLYYTGPTLDWERLRSRLGPDAPLLDALLMVYSWMCPGRPVGRSADELGNPPLKTRDALLDSRSWFLPEAGDRSPC